MKMKKIDPDVMKKVADFSDVGDRIPLKARAIDPETWPGPFCILQIVHENAEIVTGFPDRICKTREEARAVIDSNPNANLVAVAFDPAELMPDYQEPS